MEAIKIPSQISYKPFCVEQKEDSVFERENLWKIPETTLKLETRYAISQVYQNIRTYLRSFRDIEDIFIKKWLDVSKIEPLKIEVLLLNSEREKQEISYPTILEIKSLPSETYEVVKPFHIVIKPHGEEFIASFYEVKLSAMGDFESEAIENLKDIIISTYELLSEHKESKLGPGPLTQFNSLKKYIRQI